MKSRRTKRVAVMVKKFSMQIASMRVMPKHDWGNLPMEIVVEIGKRIELYDDYEAFLEVCSSWRLAIKNFPCQYMNKKHTQLPWLMLVDPDDCSYRRYYSLTKRMFLKIDLPRSLSPPQTRRYFSSQGWVISVTRCKCTSIDMYFNISLFNPLSNNNVTIEAPLFHLSNLKVYEDNECEDLLLFGKFAVSLSPYAEKSDDFVVAMTFGRHRKVSYWRRGQDNTWVVPCSPGLNEQLHDLCFFGGELYATQCDGMVIGFGDLKDHRNPRLVADLTDLIDIDHNMAGEDHTYYLVESKYEQDCSSNNLLFIHRFVVVESYVDRKYYTASFSVFKVNVDNDNVEEVKSLGNQAIFVGTNTTYAVLAGSNVEDERGGCKPDCIYYTNDYAEVYFTKNGEGGSDMGIYSLQTGNTVPVYEGSSRFSLINPPSWFEFSS